jgi:hypothetical protein
MLHRVLAPWVALNGLFAQFGKRLRRPPEPPGPSEDLRICRWCGEPFVQPLTCHREPGSAWRIVLRCGNCGRRRVVVATHEQTTRLECEVAADIVAISRALERLDRERFQAQADSFAVALDRDLVDASDFA